MENGISCISAGGKGNILQTAKQARAEEEVLLIADGAAFGPEIECILETPSEYIESQDYFSWERFFTKLLTEKTHGTYLQYSKNRINPSGYFQLYG